MRTKHVCLALVLAATAWSVQAQTAQPASERDARPPVTVGALEPRAAAPAPRAPRAAKAAPAVGAESAFSLFTYDALSATPRVQLGRRPAAPDRENNRPVAAR